MSPIVLYALVAFNNGSPQITMGMTAAQCIMQRGASDLCFAYMPKTRGATLFFRPQRGGYMNQWKTIAITPDAFPMVKWEDRWKTNPEAAPSDPAEDCEATKSNLNPSVPALCAPIYMPIDYCGS